MLPHCNRNGEALAVVAVPKAHRLVSPRRAKTSQCCENNDICDNDIINSFPVPVAHAPRMTIAATELKSLQYQVNQTNSAFYSIAMNKPISTAPATLQFRSHTSVFLAPLLSAPAVALPLLLGLVDEAVADAVGALGDALEVTEVSDNRLALAVTVTSI
ncbi:hypothetical protein ABEF93_008617 [Exophiala dermatitidis]